MKRAAISKTISIDRGGKKQTGCVVEILLWITLTAPLKKF